MPDETVRVSTPWRVLHSKSFSSSSSSSSSSHTLSSTTSRTEDTPYVTLNKSGTCSSSSTSSICYEYSTDYHAIHHHFHRHVLFLLRWINYARIGHTWVIPRAISNATEKESLMLNGGDRFSLCLTHFVLWYRSLDHECSHVSLSDSATSLPSPSHSLPFPLSLVFSPFLTRNSPLIFRARLQTSSSLRYKDEEWA